MKYELSPIESIEVVNDRFDYVYDIEMDDTTDHVFFGNDILVHNSCFFLFFFILEKKNISLTEPDRPTKIT